MRKKSPFVSTTLVAVLVCAGAVLAQAPGVDISRAKHPALAEAQMHIQQAYTKIEEAQKANKEQLGGHAEKAKQLLAEASRELKAAANYADHRR